MSVGLILAKALRHLFVNDDGSLPDIFIENISSREFENIISWIESLISPSPFRVWNKEMSKDLTLTSPSKAARFFSEGKIDSFRFPADNISFEGLVIPTLSVGVYGIEYLEFDYRMGDEWTDETIVCLLTFLSQILEIAPAATILRCEEGCHPNYDADFTNALRDFQKAKLCPASN